MIKRKMNSMNKPQKVEPEQRERTTQQRSSLASSVMLLGVLHIIMYYSSAIFPTRPFHWTTVTFCSRQFQSIRKTLFDSLLNEVEETEQEWAFASLTPENRFSYFRDSN